MNLLFDLFFNVMTAGSYGVADIDDLNYHIRAVNYLIQLLPNSLALAFLEDILTDLLPLMPFRHEVGVLFDIIDILLG